ncbi:cytochrome c [Sulfurimonas sp.]|uniref:cytochrome c n=1 Tax=Sulfurimonas sp. TaxID=2022749 RepID=UPI0025F95F26|nr:cytochrome c [Sulfurimonas sp.]
MKKAHLLLVGIYFSVSPLFAYNADSGEKLYLEAKCQKCHTSDSFTSADSKVKNLAKLKWRVKKCNFAMDAEWFDDEVDDVVHYLNKKFYKFEPSRFN